MTLQGARLTVANAFDLAPQIPFKPEDIHLGTYTFLPWVRSGVGAAVQAVPAGKLRAEARVELEVLADGKPAGTVGRDVAVRGPGDVLSFQRAQIVRRFPAPGTPDAEDTYLAHVEFDRPDFPWLFSPEAPAGDRLRPWLALVVLDATRASLQPARGKLPPRVATVLGELQPLADAWSWAHAQVAGPTDPRLGAADPALIDALSPAYGLVNLSRLLCPRRLQPGRSYLACVVPTYDVGAKTGLGTSGGGLADAWPRTGDPASAVELPVYDSWTFQTGPDGDFESLARKLHPVAAPWRIGRRVLDTSRPGAGLPPLAPEDAGRLQIVRGPLVSPAPAPADGPASDDGAWPATETEALRAALNRPDELARKPPAPAVDDVPLVGPPIYGQVHAAIRRLDPPVDAAWVGQLNLAPTTRVIAGLGTRVVQTDREAMMQSAWAQVGAINDANRQLRQAQLARFIGASLHARHLAPLDLGALVAVTRRVHGRVITDPHTGLTVNGTIAASAVAAAATTPAFRRLTRPRGPLGRYAAAAPAGALTQLLVGPTGAPRDFQRHYVDADGIDRVSDLAARALDPAIVAEVIGLGHPSESVAALKALGVRLSETVSVPDSFAPATGQINSAFDVAQFAAQQTLDVVARATPANPATSRALAASHFALLSGFKATGGPVAARAQELAAKLATGAGLATERAPDTGPIAAGAAGAAGPLPAFVLDRRTSEFALADHGDRLAAVLSQASLVGAHAAARDLAAVAANFVAADWPGTPVRPPLSLAPTALLRELHPALTVTRRVLARLGGSLPAWLAPTWFDDGLVTPIMAAPTYNRPMYEALDAYDRDWMIPGLAAITNPDFVTLLESNPTFIETFLIGLSHELGRQLLWRGYPTDRRGTYFKRFFDPSRDELRTPIHRFGQDALGTHLVYSPVRKPIVLLIRGDLVRRYPDAIVLALRAGPQSDRGRPIFEDAAADPSSTAALLFHAHLEPDIRLVGFDLTAEEVRRDNWWFVVAEHPTAPRFGLDAAPDQPAPPGRLTRDTITWADLGVSSAGFLAGGGGAAIAESDQPGAQSLQWGASAAVNAHVLLRDPFRAAFHGADLIAAIGQPS